VNPVPASWAAVSFITPNTCDDMHGLTAAQLAGTGFTNCLKGSDALEQRSDQWLSQIVPNLTAAGATVFITFDACCAATLSPDHAIATGADEGIHSLEDIRRHHERKAARGVSLKTIKLGGMRAVMEAGRLCDRLGLNVNVSTKTGESSIACAAATTLSDEKPRSSARLPTFIACCNFTPCASPSASDVSAVIPPRPAEPLIPITRWNSPFASGLACRSLIDIEPADCPISVTFPGSPPNAAMFFCTQWSAATWSRNPQFPLALWPDSFVASGCAINPNTPSR